MQFIKGREEIVQFLTKKWEKEHDYRLRKQLFCFTASHHSPVPVPARMLGPPARNIHMDETMSTVFKSCERFSKANLSYLR